MLLDTLMFKTKMITVVEPASPAENEVVFLAELLPPLPEGTVRLGAGQIHPLFEEGEVDSETLSMKGIFYALPTGRHILGSFRVPIGLTEDRLVSYIETFLNELAYGPGKDNLFITQLH